MIAKTLNKLRPGAQWTVTGDLPIWTNVVDVNGAFTGAYTLSNVVWLDAHQTMPSKEEFDEMYEAVRADAIANNYQRKRSSEYPPLTDLADALYHQANGDNTKMEAYLAACEAVKQKYPKGA